MAEQNDTMLTDVMNLLETKSFIIIPVIRNVLKAMACTGCNDAVDVLFWLKAVEELDDEKLLKCYKEFEYCKKSLKSLSGLDTESFNMFCARLAVMSSPK